jgi:hypothetical protein
LIEKIAPRGVELVRRITHTPRSRKSPPPFGPRCETFPRTTLKLPQRMLSRLCRALVNRLP